VKSSNTRVMILLLIVSSFLVQGCSPIAWLLPEKPVLVPAGRTVEIAEPVKFKGIITAPDGTKSKRTVQAWSGWRAGPPAPATEVK
jgi:hypothetical protein